MRESDIEAMLDALRSGWLTMGPRIQKFEAAFAAWSGARHAVAVSSGTAALHLACLALRVAPGERVVLPAYGSPAALNAVRHCGAEAVFVDVVSASEPVIDPVAARAAGARVAIAQHTYGCVADVAALGCDVIEDCRDLLERRVTGVAGCFSFADGRQLAIGEGGMVTTESDAIAERVRLLRAHAMTSGTWDRHRGHSDSYDVVDVGFNFRLDEPRAALGLSLLSHIDEDLRPAYVVGAGETRPALAGLPNATRAALSLRVAAAS